MSTCKARQFCDKKLLDERNFLDYFIPVSRDRNQQGRREYFFTEYFILVSRDKNP